MLYKEFGLQAEKRLQNLEEVAYMNGLITHLQEVDKGLTYRPVYVSDPAEYDDEFRRTPKDWKTKFEKSETSVIMTKVGFEYSKNYNINLFFHFLVRYCDLKRLI